VNMKRYALPAIALSLVALYIVSLLTEETTERRVFLQPDASVVELEIKNGDEVYGFKKEGGLWKMSRPVRWKANGRLIEELIGRLKETVLENPITDKEERYNDYGVGAEADYIKAVTAGGGVFTLYKGRRGPKYSLVYVRSKDDAFVYLVKSRFADSLPRGRDDFRDKTVVSLPQDEIREVRWESGEKSFALTRKDDGWYAGERKLSTEEVSAYLARISTITAIGFPEDDRLPEDAEPAGRLYIDAGKEITLDLYKKGGEYFFVRDGVPYRIAVSLKNNIFKEIKEG